MPLVPVAVMSPLRWSVLMVNWWRFRAASAEPKRCGSLPLVGEAVDLVEFDRAAGVDEVLEHAASADGGELHRVADHHDSPRSVVGEGGELVELVGRDHSGFVDDHGRAALQVVGVPRAGSRARARSRRGRIG